MKRLDIAFPPQRQIDILNRIRAKRAVFYEMGRRGRKKWLVDNDGERLMVVTTQESDFIITVWKIWPGTRQEREIERKLSARNSPKPKPVDPMKIDPDEAKRLQAVMRSVSSPAKPKKRKAPQARLIVPEKLRRAREKLAPLSWIACDQD